MKTAPLELFATPSYLSYFVYGFSLYECLLQNPKKRRVQKEWW